MPSPRNVVHLWNTLSLRTRIFVPLVLLTLAVATGKYQVMFKTTVATADAVALLQVPHIQRYVLPALAAVPPQNSAALQRILDAEAQDSPDIAAIRWQSGTLHIEARNLHPVLRHYPAWFGRLVHLVPTPLQLVLPPRGDTPLASTLTLQTDPTAALNRAWQTVLPQLWVTGLAVALVFFLSTLVLRANGRMLQRLAGAVAQFKQGRYETRMPIIGPYEARVLAEVFNATAQEIQNLLHQLRRTQADLLAEKERAEVTLSSIGDAVITTDLAGHIETSNTVAQQLTGWTAQQAKGRPLHEVFELQDELGGPGPKDARAPLYQTHDVVHANHYVLVRPSGERCAIECTAAPIRQADGRSVGCVLVFRDVSEKRQLIQEISWQVGHDVLTGLHNRAAMQEPFTMAVRQARHQRKLLAVCLLDLDHFQHINAQYGSLYADRLLQSVAQRLAQYAGDNHGLARLGGDEFLLLLENQHSLAEIEKHAAQVLALLAEPYPLDQQQIRLTTSIGIAVYPHGDQQQDANLDTLLRQADQAMYLAKQTGRGRFHLFDAQRDQEVQTDHHQRARVAQALQGGELRLYYQPKVNMRTGQVFGMEALLRWQHPDKGIVGPYHFLPLVEDTDLIIDIGEWVLVDALQQMQHWAQQGPHWVVSVNIAARHFQRPDFVDRLSDILARFPQVSPHRLELEVLESAALEDVQHMRNVMASCQQLGVQFALDDFGTGYSSLAYLKRLPANTLKIDQSFVRDILEDPDDLTLVDAIIGLAHAFGRHVIAEGVETVEHGLLLLQRGCDLAQGYGIARPMPADAVIAWAAGFVPAQAWQQWVAEAEETA